MASVYSITTEGEEALGAATTETVLGLHGAAAVKAKILQWSVSFDSTSATAQPVVVRLKRHTTVGTNSAASEVAWDPDNPTANCAGFHSYTAEGTIGDILESYNVHPQSGIVIQYPLGREPTIDNATTSRIGIDCTAPAAVNVLATLVWEE